MDGVPDYTGHRRVVLNDDDKQRELLNSDELPRDAKVMALILKSMGVDEFEPKVIHQMLEFMNRTFESQFYAFVVPHGLENFFSFSHFDLLAASVFVCRMNSDAETLSTCRLCDRYSSGCREIQRTRQQAAFGHFRHSFGDPVSREPFIYSTSA